MNTMHTRNRRYRYSPGVALLLALFMSQACATPTAVDFQTGTVTLTLYEEPPQLDSTRATDVISGQVLGHVMEGLLRYDADNQLVGAVAERWEISDDGLTVTFRLRRDARWSDGSSVTAHDFIFAWRTILDPDTDARYAFLLYDIQHAREICSSETCSKQRPGTPRKRSIGSWERCPPTSTAITTAHCTSRSTETRSSPFNGRN